MRKTTFLAASYSQPFAIITRSMAAKTMTVPLPLLLLLPWRSTRAKRTPSTGAPKRPVTCRTSSRSPDAAGSATCAALAMAALASVSVSPRLTSVSCNLSSGARRARRAVALSRTTAMHVGTSDSATASASLLRPIIGLSKSFTPWGITKSSSPRPFQIFFLKLRHIWPPSFP